MSRASVKLLGGEMMGIRGENKLDGININELPVGKHCDGAGLWLVKRDDGGAQWVNRVVVSGKRREMGLGSINVVSLQAARIMAKRNAILAKSGSVQIPDALTRIIPNGNDNPKLVAMKVEYSEILDAIDLAMERAKDLYANIAAYKSGVK